MKTDINGCSTCPTAQEMYETFKSRGTGRTFVQYDYRTPQGLLFSTVGFTLAMCRQKRDNWLKGLNLG